MAVPGCGQRCMTGCSARAGPICCKTCALLTKMSKLPSLRPLAWPSHRASCECNERLRAGSSSKLKTVAGTHLQLVFAQLRQLRAVSCQHVSDTSLGAHHNALYLVSTVMPPLVAAIRDAHVSSCLQDAMQDLTCTVCRVTFVIPCLMHQYAQHSKAMPAHERATTPVLHQGIAQRLTDICRVRCCCCIHSTRAQHCCQRSAQVRVHITIQRYCSKCHACADGSQQPSVLVEVGQHAAKLARCCARCLRHATNVLLHLH